MTPLPIEPGDLVAIDAPPGPHWLDLVTQAWDRDAAVLPLDPRASPAQREAVLRSAKPTLLVTEDMPRRIDGEPVEAGIGLVIATSGTTGDPKAVELRREAIIAAVGLGAERLGLDGGESWACPIPVAHIGGMLVVARGIVLGAPVRFDLDAPAAWAAIVPTQLRRMLDAREPLADRCFLVGGDALDPRLRAGAEAAGARIVSTYGSSETCGGVVYDHVPLDGVEVRADSDGGLSIASPTLMTRYRSAHPHPIQDGWLRTADRGRVVNGLVFVEGRIDDVVIVAGEKFSRAELTSSLASMDGVEGVRVEAVKDPEYGHRLRVRYRGDATIQAVRTTLRERHGGLAATAEIARDEPDASRTARD